MTPEDKKVHVKARDASGLPALLMFEGRAFVHGDILDSAAEQARAAAFEEAAKIADERASYMKDRGDAETDSAHYEAVEIAAAIRQHAKGVGK